MATGHASLNKDECKKEFFKLYDGLDKVDGHISNYELILWFQMLYGIVLVPERVMGWYIESEPKTWKTESEFSHYVDYMYYVSISRHNRGCSPAVIADETRKVALVKLGDPILVRRIATTVDGLLLTWIALTSIRGRWCTPIIGG